MTTYNTGNPIGSTAVKDLYDNAENLNVLVNDKTKESHPDRFGVARKTWHGVEQDFQRFLINSGYQDIGSYAAGLEITARNQIFWRDGELYRAGAVLELPYTTTGDWGDEEGLFVAVGDAALRQDLADPDKGAAMVSYLNTTVSGALDARTINFKDYGGIDDSVPSSLTYPGEDGTDNSEALSRVMSKHSTGRLHFPKTDTGVYFFSSVPTQVFNGWTISADPGVVLRTPGEQFSTSNGATLLTDIVTLVTSSNTYFTLLKDAPVQERNPHRTDKSHFMSPGDYDNTQYRYINTADVVECEAFSYRWPNGPLNKASSLSVGSDRFSFTAGASGLLQLAAIRAIPGTEVVFSAVVPDEIQSGTLAVGVKTLGGFDVYTEDMANPIIGGHSIKEGSTPVVTGSVGVEGIATHEGIRLRNALIGVRVINNREFVVTVNGQTRMRAKAQNYITHVVMGGMYVPGDFVFKDFVRISNKVSSGLRPIDIYTVGDSTMTNAINGSWVNHMAEALEYTAGCRVRSINNQAVGGHSSDAQLALLQAANLDRFRLGVIDIGINDQQSGKNVGLFVQNVLDMVSLFVTSNTPVVVCVQSAYYERAQASLQTGFPNQGQASSNEQAMGPYRSLLIRQITEVYPSHPLVRICMTGLEDQGVIISDLLSMGIDPTVYDNIHPSGLARKVKGYAVARTAASLLNGVSSREYPITPVPASWGGSGVDVSGVRFSVDDSGTVRLHGHAKSSSPLINNQEILTVDTFLAPPMDHVSTVTYTDSSSTYTGVGAMRVWANGRLSTIFPSSGVYGVYLDGLTYKPRG